MVDENKPRIVVKPPTTHAEQVNILKSRGLIFGDEEKAAQILEYTNYYRLRGYYIRLLKAGSDDFQEGVTFEQVLEYYGSNVPLFRRNGYRQSGATIP